MVFSGSPVLLGSPNSDSPVPRDPAALAVIQRYEGPVRELAAQTIGTPPPPHCHVHQPLPHVHP